MSGQHRPTRRGFTLIEILVVVVILGIAGAIIVPQLSTRDDLRLRAAARVVMADLIYAQNLAITQQSTHLVRFSTAAQNYSVIRASSMSIVNHPVNKTPFTVQLNTGGMAGITVYSASFVGQSTNASATLGFDELGTPQMYTGGGATETMTSGSIVLQSGQFKFKIELEPYTGQIKGDFVP